MNGIFKRLNNKKGSQKHPNSDYFFFQVLNDFSPLPYFYWWGNFLFIIFYYFTFNIFKLNTIQLRDIFNINHYIKDSEKVRNI